MKRSLASTARRFVHQTLRSALARLPRDWRFGFYRRLVDCDAHPDPRLELKIADTQDELEACFRILHDAYVAVGFMKPDPSGLRVTIYHALPTTTTLCAKWDGQVVGTISMIRDGAFGFPLQSVFNLRDLRSRAGRIAEISALAIDPAFRRTGGAILFPLMKFMYEYCREYFDTRHIVIAVNPNKIEMYESLLFFQRLQARVVDNYDFANGAPAVGASLDLKEAPEVFRKAYAGKPARRNLHDYFVKTRLSNIKPPPRRFHTTNDPVLTPALLDYFFNRRTQVFSTLDERKRMLLRSIYDDPAYAAVLPSSSAAAAPGPVLRQHPRFSIRCPATLTLPAGGAPASYRLQVIDLSMHGLQAECDSALPNGCSGRLEVELGRHERAVIEVVAMRRQLVDSKLYYGFAVPAPDLAWQRCVQVLQSGLTYADLVEAATPLVEAASEAEPARV